jgi:hypothetical protein
MSSPTTSLNTLIYKAILTLILKGFKRFLAVEISRKFLSHKQAATPFSLLTGGMTLGPVL